LWAQFHQAWGWEQGSVLALELGLEFVWLLAKGLEFVWLLAKGLEFVWLLAKELGFGLGSGSIDDAFLAHLRSWEGRIQRPEARDLPL
jgi:hypothetical protein